MANAINRVNNTNCTFQNNCANCQQSDQEISCFKKIAGVLSSEEMKKLGLIIDPKEKNFSPTVYDLSLGGFHYLYGNEEGKQHLTPVCIDSDTEMQKENAKGEEKFVRPNGPATTILTIPPLGSALIQLNEIIDTYSIADANNVLVTGRFDLKLSLVNQGLVSQQGTQVEPCYRGRLYCFVHNFSNKPIDLKYGAPIASVEFLYVSCFCNEDKRIEVICSLFDQNKKRYTTDDYCDPGKGILNVRYFRRKKTLPDECGLFSAISIAKSTASEVVTAEKTINEISKKVSAKIDNRRIILTTFITAAASIVVAVIAGVFGYLMPMNDANKDYKDKIDSLQQEIQELEKHINELNHT